MNMLVYALIDLSNGSDKFRELELNIILSNAGKVVKEKNEKLHFILILFHKKK